LVFWREYAQVKKLNGRFIHDVRFTQSGRTVYSGALQILPIIEAKIKIKHGIILNGKNPFLGYEVERVFSDRGNAKVYRLESKSNLLRRTNTSPFLDPEPWREPGIELVLPAPDETVSLHRRRLQLVLVPYRRGVLSVVTLHENHVN
jgi:hypothetical protein